MLLHQESLLVGLALTLSLALLPSPVLAEVHHKSFQVQALPVHTLVGLVPPHLGPAKATVLFLHGQRFQAKTWQDLGTLEQLPKAGVDAVAVDLPGFGLTPPSPLAQTDPKKWLVEFLAASKPVLKRTPILVAPSMSGRFALPALVQDPTLFVGWMAVAPVGVRDLTFSIDKLPTVAMYGQKDGMQRDLVHLKDVFKNFRSTIVPDARHPCYLDDPALFHTTLLALVACTSEGGAGVLAACEFPFQ